MKFELSSIIVFESMSSLTKEKKIWEFFASLIQFDDNQLSIYFQSKAKRRIVELKAINSRVLILSRVKNKKKNIFSREKTKLL